MRHRHSQNCGCQGVQSTGHTTLTQRTSCGHPGHRPTRALHPRAQLQEEQEPQGLDRAEAGATVHRTGGENRPFPHLRPDTSNQTVTPQVDTSTIPLTGSQGQQTREKVSTAPASGHLWSPNSDHQSSWQSLARGDPKAPHPGTRQPAPRAQHPQRDGSPRLALPGPPASLCRVSQLQAR